MPARSADKIRDIVERRGVFDRDGWLRRDHVASAATYLCKGAFDDSGP